MANKVNLQKIKSEMIVSISFRKFISSRRRTIVISEIETKQAELEKIVSIIFRKFISSRRRTIVN